MTPLIEKYSHTNLGELVIMLSLDGVQPLLPHVCLTLEDPRALQDLCRDITFQIDEAVYDEDAMGWNRRYSALADLFKKTGVGSLPPEDQWRFLFWLENGTVPTMHAFPHRNFWHDSLSWVVHVPDALNVLDPATLPLVMEFSRRAVERLKNDAYEEAKEVFAEGPDSFLDTFQKTKFHINVIPDAIVSQHLIGLNWMRRIHIVREECEQFIADGHNIAVLEDMVVRYAEAEVTSKWLVDYVADRDAFTYDRLWSDTYREAAQ